MDIKGHLASLNDQYETIGFSYKPLTQDFQEEVLQKLMESSVQELDDNEGVTAIDLDVQILFQKSNSLRSSLLQFEKEKDNFDED